MTGLAHDIRYAARSLRRAPGFTALSAAVLALGIGANGAIFSLLDAALLRPLPYQNPDRLVMLWERSPRNAHARVAPLNYLDWSEQQQAFESIAAIAGGSRTLTDPRRAPERIPGQAVTFRFFDLLGVVPVAGRTFNAGDAAQRANVVVLNERFWKARFGGDPALVGRIVTLDGEPFTVVGIVPADFQILFAADIWTIFGPRRSPEQRQQHYLQVIGRLRPGVSIEQASADMGAVAARIADLSPETNNGWGVTIEPLRDGLVGIDMRTTALVLTGIVAFVLLMACANVANLLLARALSRSRETAIRAAIGGSRARIVRQLLVESVMVAVVGGTVGTLAAAAAIDAAPWLLPRDTLPAGLRLAFDSRVGWTAGALTLLTAMVCGALPAWQAANAPLTQVLAGGGRGSTGKSGFLRSAIVTGQVAAAALLLSGAGLFVRSLLALDRVEPGFRGDHVLTGSILLPFNRYAAADRMPQFYDRAERALAALPGVASAAFGGSLPFDGFNIGQAYELVGEPAPDRANMPLAHYQIVSTAYFRTLGIDLLRGRAFNRFDTSSAPPVCIVNEEFVRRHLGGRDPLGVRVSVQSMDLRGGPTPVVREIVGVARQVYVEVGGRERPIEIYVPIAQNPWFSASIVLRTAAEPMAQAQAMRAAIATVDPELPVTRIRTMDEVVAEATSQPRFRARIVAIFAAIAVLLAAVGIFGVLAYSVSLRTRELGIRVVLGARTQHVLWPVLRDAVLMTGTGMLAGLAASLALTRLVASLLFRVAPLDPIAFASAAAILAATSTVACIVPALRAIQADPLESVKSEV